MIGIVRFIYDRCKALDVEFRFNHYVEASNLFLQKSDVVILATGGVPNLHEIEGANEFAVSSWDVLSGEVRLSGNFLV